MPEIGYHLRINPLKTQNRLAAVLIILVALLPAIAGGCATQVVSLRPVPKSPLVEQFDLTSYNGPKPSDRTMQLLRVYNVADEPGWDFRPALQKLQAINNRESSAEIVYAMSELAFLGGKKAEKYDRRAALDLYGASVLHAYEYLFDPRFAATRNPYDPHYRGACDLYNGSLESALRIVCANKELVPGTTKTITTAAGKWDVTCVIRNTRWRPKDFKRFEFVSDYEVKGLRNLHLTHGLGVPLIAVRNGGWESTDKTLERASAEKYYPPDLSFPVTALLRPLCRMEGIAGQSGLHNQCVLELYDPLSTDQILIADQRVPLESDLTTPLAYFLSKPELGTVATIGLLRPDELLKIGRPGGQSVFGLYMVQPYEPGKIPVLMVHGLWSTPMTWMEMFNDLRSMPRIRERYQFWFYLYPTGQPFWQSAAQLRRDLKKMRETLDPKHEEPALDQMVLIGHSMGGLVSRLQTVQSGEEFWKLVSNEPFPQIKADAETKRKLAETFFFEPNPSIRRVVTIGTPHRGSTYSNETTQWLLRKLIYLPSKLVLIASPEQLYRDNPGAFPEKSLAKVQTSVDSLSPDSPIFNVMLTSRRAPWVKYHNIVGVMPKRWWLSKLAADGDGVVSRSSAHVDDAVSEIIVPADHTTVHTHPAAVLEVRRILFEHLAELDGPVASNINSRANSYSY